MRRDIQLRLGDVVKVIDVEDPELRLISLTITNIDADVDVYGSVPIVTYRGLTSGKGTAAGGREVSFTEDIVVGVNENLKPAKEVARRLLENSIKATATRLTLTEQLLVLGVLKAYAN